MNRVKKLWNDCLPQRKFLYTTLLWCLPALLLGLGIRVALMAQMPSVFIHDDTRFILDSAERLVQKGSLDIEGRKTFLTPVIYAVILKLKLPLLPTLSVLQHLAGMLGIFVSALLVRAWFPRWQLWIIPITLMFAAEPVILWYEHAALPEFLFCFFTMVMMAAGAWFYRQPSPYTFATLLVVGFLTAGARPEGNLLGAYTILLCVFAFWGRWKQLGIYTLIATVAVVGTMKMTPSNQGGKFLMTTLLPMIPDQVHCAPGFGEALHDLKESVKDEWVATPTDLNSNRKRVEEIASAYLQKEKGMTQKEAEEKTDALCKKVAFETILRNWEGIPSLAYRKFLVTHKDGKLRQSHKEIPAGPFSKEWLNDRQLVTLYDTPEEPSHSIEFARYFFGHIPSSYQEARLLVIKTWQPFEPDWLTSWQEAFNGMLLSVKLPDQDYGEQWVPGLPLLYPYALLALLLLALLPRPAPRDLFIWVVVMCGLAFAVFLTGNVRARYRFVFEPLWIFGLCAGLEVMRILLMRTVFGGDPCEQETSEADSDKSPAKKKKLKHQR